MSSVFPNWFVPDSLFSVKVCPFCSQFHLDFYHEGGCSIFSKAFSATIDMIAAVSFSGQLGIICNQLGEGPWEKLSRSGFKGFSYLDLLRREDHLCMWVLPFHGLVPGQTGKEAKPDEHNTHAFMALCRRLYISDRMDSNLDWARCVLSPLSPLSGCFVTATGNKTKMAIPGILFFEYIHVLSYTDGSIRRYWTSLANWRWSQLDYWWIIFLMCSSIQFTSISLKCMMSALVREMSL